MDYISVQTEDFDIAQIYRKLRSDDLNTGAIVVFTGLVRELNQQQQVRYLELEHYAGMVERVLEKIIHDARCKWALNCVSVIHRIGCLEPSEQIVFVGVASAHRKDAFGAAQFIMDMLKRDVPIWKREVTPQGSHWVQPELRVNKP